MIEKRKVTRTKPNGEWHVARTAEVKALNDKNVLREATSAELAEIRSSRTTVLGTRFVYKTKLKADGSVERYKARLVVQGFNQRLGLHYQADNVESPTVHSNFQKFGSNGDSAQLSYRPDSRVQT